MGLCRKQVVSPPGESCVRCDGLGSVACTGDRRLTGRVVEIGFGSGLYVVDRRVARLGADADPNLVMGAAIAMHGDTHRGDGDGTSMAVTLAVADVPACAFTYSWAQASALLPSGAA